MNKDKREKLGKAIIKLQEGRDLVERVLDQESDCLDKVPGNLILSDKYSQMENTVERLEDSIERIDATIDDLEEASR